MGVSKFQVSAMKTFDFHPPDATPIGNTNYSFQTIGGRVHYFANLDPVYSHPEENEHEQSLYIALLAMNRVPVPDLAEAFEKCERTIYRNLRTLRKKGAQAFYHVPQPRGRTAIDADKQAEAEKLLSEGKSIGKTAAELGIVIRRCATTSRRAGSSLPPPPPTRTSRKLRRPPNLNLPRRPNGSPPRQAETSATIAIARLRWAEPPGTWRIGSAFPSAT